MMYNKSKSLNILKILKALNILKILKEKENSFYLTLKIHS